MEGYQPQGPLLLVVVSNLLSIERGMVEMMSKSHKNPKTSNNSMPAGERQLRLNYGASVRALAMSTQTLAAE